jgi:vitamin B12/bleomycin/antimicrobial peptide transport system ATP-binding/permease protein
MELKTIGFLRDAWRLTVPYFRSDEKIAACGLLAVVVALNLFAVWLTVRFNLWYRDFYDALQQYDWSRCSWQIAIFCILATVWVIVGVYQFYLRQILHIRWRQWLTENYLSLWLRDQAYYRLQLDQSVTDNPDQRIADDLDRFASSTLALSLGLMNSATTLVSFVFILWSLSGTFAVPLWAGFVIHIPGYLVFVALIYAAIGTWLTQRIGHPLARLLFDQQRYEADFRFSLVRLREHAESVAFFDGERREYDIFSARFARVVANWWDIIIRRKKITWFTSSYSQAAVIVPILAAMPRYLAKQIRLGGLMQIVSAFGSVQDALSFIVNSYTDIAEYKSVVERLQGFRGRVNDISGQRHGSQPIEISRGGEGVSVHGLDLALPNGQMLREDIALAARPDKPLLVTGPSGSGKSTLLRAIAGLWPFGRGAVRLGDGHAFFLPQRPYLPLGTLADAVAYPATGRQPSRGELEAALRMVGLSYLIPRLDEDGIWAQRLSGGEQQRIGFARALLARPEIIFLDESTSALDEAAEAQLYRLLREADWRPTIVSVGHRGTLHRFHDTIVDLARYGANGAAGVTATAAAGD